ncbi:hypothetical protein J6590_059915, partial [Homalodisca vitripennis]
VVESPQPSNLVSPAYSLFSPAWTAPQHPPPPVASLMGQQGYPESKLRFALKPLGADYCGHFDVRAFLCSVAIQPC